MDLQKTDLTMLKKLCFILGIHLSYVRHTDYSMQNIINIL